MKKKYYKKKFSFYNLIKIGNSLYIILTSIYDIKEDITKIKKEHGLLIIGFILLFKTIKEILEKSKELKTNLI